MGKPAHKLEPGQYIVKPVDPKTSGVYFILSRKVQMPPCGPGAQVTNPSIVQLVVRCYFTGTNECGYVVGSSDVIRACENNKDEIKKNFLPNWGESSIAFLFSTLEEIVDGQVTLSVSLTIGEPHILGTFFNGTHHSRSAKKTPPHHKKGEGDA